MIFTKTQIAEVTVNPGRIIIAADLLSWIIDGKTYPLDDKQYEVLKTWIEASLSGVTEIKNITIPKYTDAVSAKMASAEALEETIK